MANVTKKKMGAPTKAEKDKVVRLKHSFPPELAAYIGRLPDRKKSKFVQNAVKVYKAVIEGRAKLVAAEGQEDELQEILQEISLHSDTR